MAKYTGQCACGAVKFAFDKDPDFVADCYCTDCRKASGGIMATFFGVPETDFTLLSGSTKGFEYVANSGKKLTRRFCPDCGARLYTDRLEAFPGLVFVQIGSLDRPELIQPKLEMFTKRRPGWAKAVDVPQFTDMPH